MSGFSGNSLGETIQHVAPATGATVNISTGKTVLAVDPAGTLATLTINLPSNPGDGKRVKIAASQVITSLTLGNGTIVGAVTSLALGGFAQFVFVGAASKWFRCG